MSLSRYALSAVLVGLALAGCAKPPNPELAFAPVVDRAIVTGSIFPASSSVLDQPAPERIFATGNLGGRTLAVATTTDIILRPREVVLTFDDGPRPRKTETILQTLDDYGVKATFLMLGSAAQAHPKLAQRVAAAGHTVGSHTFAHTDLSTLGSQAALDEIARGERAVQTALAGGGETLAPFFRFPYLSQTGFLRTNLLQGDMVVLDVDIDSKDYYRDTPEVIVARTMGKLRARGQGIVLFHDIHQRTVETLPLFLAELKREGYSVVRLVHKDPSVFGRDLITAEAPAGDAI